MADPTPPASQPNAKLWLAAAAVAFLVLMVMLITRLDFGSDEASPAPTPVAPANQPSELPLPDEQEGTITGKVTGTNYQPNRAEDGHYLLQVEDANGAVYIINATGYMNTPLQPADNGEACTEVPAEDAVMGKTVSFKLPEKGAHDGTNYVTCFPQADASKYFFTLTK